MPDIRELPWNVLQEIANAQRGQLKEISARTKIPLPRLYKIRQKISSEWDIPDLGWSEEDTKKLIELFRAGVSQREIARILNRNESSIRGKLYRVRYNEYWESQTEKKKK